ncbi:MAG: cation:proton antiporter, partial [Alkalispirochaeta sp.]
MTFRTDNRRPDAETQGGGCCRPRSALQLLSPPAFDYQRRFALSGGSGYRVRMTARRMYRVVPSMVMWLVVPALAAAAENDPHGVSAGHSLEHRMTMLALQIGVILFAGYFGTRIARRLKIPVILGEILAGIVIGPWALGAVGFPGYPEGLFPPATNALSISPELYGFAVVASIVLLFLMGLETDIRLFLRFAVKGSVVGLTGAVLSVGAGILIGRLMIDAGPGDPRSLFLGVVAIATSVDITGRILSERHKMASPEGVTILSASVIEDVIGITLLAVVLGVDAMRDVAGNGVVWREVLAIAGRALGVWLGFTTLGIVFARRIGSLLKAVRNPAQIAVLSLGLALILAGLFEAAGLAMIIGAYVMGLSLANTDISYVVQ